MIELSNGVSQLLLAKGEILKQRLLLAAGTGCFDLVHGTQMHRSADQKSLGKHRAPRQKKNGIHAKGSLWLDARTLTSTWSYAAPSILVGVMEMRSPSRTNCSLLTGSRLTRIR